MTDVASGAKHSYRTEDGVELQTGDGAFDYYNHKPGAIGNDAGGFEGWFDFHHTDGVRELLNGQRICSLAYAKRRGWITRADEIAVDFSCPDCSADCARGDESKIVYCGSCGREWHVGDAGYPASFRPLAS